MAYQTDSIVCFRTSKDGIAVNAEELHDIDLTVEAVNNQDSEKNSRSIEKQAKKKRRRSSTQGVAEIRKKKKTSPNSRSISCSKPGPCEEKKSFDTMEKQNSSYKGILEQKRLSPEGSCTPNELFQQRKSQKELKDGKKNLSNGCPQYIEEFSKTDDMAELNNNFVCYQESSHVHPLMNNHEQNFPIKCAYYQNYVDNMSSVQENEQLKISKDKLCVSDCDNILDSECKDNFNEDSFVPSVRCRRELVDDESGNNQNNNTNGISEETSNYESNSDISSVTTCNNEVSGEHNFIMRVNHILANNENQNIEENSNENDASEEKSTNDCNLLREIMEIISNSDKESEDYSWRSTEAPTVTEDRSSELAAMSHFQDKGPCITSTEKSLKSFDQKECDESSAFSYQSLPKIRGIGKYLPNKSSLSYLSPKSKPTIPETHKGNFILAGKPTKDTEDSYWRKHFRSPEPIRLPNVDDSNYHKLSSFSSTDDKSVCGSSRSDGSNVAVQSHVSHVKKRMGNSIPETLQNQHALVQKDSSKDTVLKNPIYEYYYKLKPRAFNPTDGPSLKIKDIQFKASSTNEQNNSKMDAVNLKATCVAIEYNRECEVSTIDQTPRQEPCPSLASGIEPTGLTMEERLTAEIIPGASNWNKNFKHVQQSVLNSIYSSSELQMKNKNCNQPSGWHSQPNSCPIIKDTQSKDLKNVSIHQIGAASTSNSITKSRNRSIHSRLVGPLMDEILQDYNSREVHTKQTKSCQDRKQQSKHVHNTANAQAHSSCSFKEGNGKSYSKHSNFRSDHRYAPEYINKRRPSEAYAAKEGGSVIDRLQLGSTLIPGNYNKLQKDYLEGKQRQEEERKRRQDILRLRYKKESGSSSSKPYVPVYKLIEGDSNGNGFSLKRVESGFKEVDKTSEPKINTINHTEQDSIPNSQNNHGDVDSITTNVDTGENISVEVKCKKNDKHKGVDSSLHPRIKGSAKRNSGNIQKPKETSQIHRDNNKNWNNKSSEPMFKTENLNESNNIEQLATNTVNSVVQNTKFQAIPQSTLQGCYLPYGYQPYFYYSYPNINNYYPCNSKEEVELNSLPTRNELLHFKHQNSDKKSNVANMTNFVGNAHSQNDTVEFTKLKQLSEATSKKDKSVKNSSQNSEILDVQYDIVGRVLEESAKKPVIETHHAGKTNKGSNSKQKIGNKKKVNNEKVQPNEVKVPQWKNERFYKDWNKQKEIAKMTTSSENTALNRTRNDDFTDIASTHSCPSAEIGSYKYDPKKYSPPTKEDRYFKWSEEVKSRSLNKRIEQIRNEIGSNSFLSGRENEINDTGHTDVRSVQSKEKLFPKDCWVGATSEAKAHVKQTLQNLIVKKVFEEHTGKDYPLNISDQSGISTLTSKHCAIRKIHESEYDITKRNLVAKSQINQLQKKESEHFSLKKSVRVTDGTRCFKPGNIVHISDPNRKSSVMYYAFDDIPLSVRGNIPNLNYQDEIKPILRNSISALSECKCGGGQAVKDEQDNNVSSSNSQSSFESGPQYSLSYTKKLMPSPTASTFNVVKDEKLSRKLNDDKPNIKNTLSYKLNQDGSFSNSKVTSQSSHGKNNGTQKEKDRAQHNKTEKQKPSTHSYKKKHGSKSKHQKCSHLDENIVTSDTEKKKKSNSAIPKPNYELLQDADSDDSDLLKPIFITDLHPEDTSNELADGKHTPVNKSNKYTSNAVQEIPENHSSVQEITENELTRQKSDVKVNNEDNKNVKINNSEKGSKLNSYSIEKRVCKNKSEKDGSNGLKKAHLDTLTRNKAHIVNTDKMKTNNSGKDLCELSKKDTYTSKQNVQLSKKKALTEKTKDEKVQTSGCESGLDSLKLYLQGKMRRREGSDLENSDDLEDYNEFKSGWIRSRGYGSSQVKNPWSLLNKTNKTIVKDKDFIRNRYYYLLDPSANNALDLDNNNNISRQCHGKLIDVETVTKGVDSKKKSHNAKQFSSSSSSTNDVQCIVTVNSPPTEDNSNKVAVHADITITLPLAKHNTNMTTGNCKDKTENSRTSIESEVHSQIKRKISKQKINNTRDNEADFVKNCIGSNSQDNISDEAKKAYEKILQVDFRKKVAKELVTVKGRKLRERPKVNYRYSESDCSGDEITPESSNNEEDTGDEVKSDNSYERQQQEKSKKPQLRSYYRKSPTKGRKEERAMRAIAQEQAKIYAIIKMKNKEKHVDEKVNSSREPLHKVHDGETSSSISLRLRTYSGSSAGATLDSDDPSIAALKDFDTDTDPERNQDYEESLDSKSICSASCSHQGESLSRQVESSCSQQQDVDERYTVKTEQSSKSDWGQVQLKYVDEVEHSLVNYSTQKCYDRRTLESECGYINLHAIKVWLPYVEDNGYKYVPVREVTPLFRNCVGRCGIPKSTMQKDPELGVKMCNHHQANLFGNIWPIGKESSNVHSGDMMLKWNEFCNGYRRIRRMVVELHRNTTRKWSKGCKYTFKGRGVQYALQ